MKRLWVILLVVVAAMFIAADTAGLIRDLNNYSTTRHSVLNALTGSGGVGASAFSTTVDSLTVRIPGLRSTSIVFTQIYGTVLGQRPDTVDIIRYNYVNTDTARFVRPATGAGDHGTSGSKFFWFVVRW